MARRDAWGEPGVLAAFIGMAEGTAPSRRPPATRFCASPDEAKQWVESEARAFGVPVEWVGGGFAPEGDVAL